MATLKETALNYEPHQLHNIADLPEVSVDFEVREETNQDSDGKEYTYKFIDISGKKYRIPNTVIEEVQKILKIKSDVKAVKVNKKGEGLKTRYSVEVLE